MSGAVEIPDEAKAPTEFFRFAHQMAILTGGGGARCKGFIQETMVLPRARNALSASVEDALVVLPGVPCLGCHPSGRLQA